MLALNSASPLGTSAPLEEVFLNAASLHSSSALIILLQSENLQNIQTLIDSGTSHCFLDSRFALSNNLPLSNLKILLRLSLFDGSITSQGLIYQYTTLPVVFPCGTQHTI